MYCSTLARLEQVDSVNLSKVTQTLINKYEVLKVTQTLIKCDILMLKIVLMNLSKVTLTFINQMLNVNFNPPHIVKLLLTADSWKRQHKQSSTLKKKM